MLDNAENSATSIENKRQFSTFSALGIGYSITNTALGVLLVVGTVLPFGGAPLLLGGFLMMAVIALSTAISLAELCSAMPHPGGQYIWVNRLAPPEYRRFLSYATGMTGWFSAIIIGASGCLAVFQYLFSLIKLLKPAFVYQRWMGFAGYQALNLITLLLATFKFAQPTISKLMLILSCITFGVFSITLFAMSTTRATTESFLGPLDNASGWPNGAAFLIGVNGLNWIFSCLDVTTHLAEEIPSPATNIPKVLMWTIAIGFCSGLITILAILVNLPDGIDASDDNSAVVLIYRITHSKVAAAVLSIPILIVSMGTVWAVQLWQSRLAWTLSREAAFPLHHHFCRLASSPFHTPIWSLFGSAFGTAIAGCLYLGSEIAFTSFSAAGVILQYFTYSLPVILVHYRGRAQISHGPFWFPMLGCIANVIMLGWTLIVLVFYSFPPDLPVSTYQANYTPGILVLILSLICFVWFSFGRKFYEVKDM
ncbi:hypothetical protein PFICI_06354 [Pestalotiopsis fici W106-1]|uniref:Choline transport protein n=1 Tax=Pestalotiopsis fici (strain W106-1 / CGMCC3.15140) TaxID=1229662 RepID=W3X7J3_PESFW|nr:uncharacterized protein PFICI_06354 [Pestalotiopsis fici W106-1]ETS81352.1 hypothetical protein PFICI_06354 [Pestalotiopsis fici W106-1]